MDKCSEYSQGDSVRRYPGAVRSSRKDSFRVGRVRDHGKGRGKGVPSGVHRADVSLGDYAAARVLAAAARAHSDCHPRQLVIPLRPAENGAAARRVVNLFT